MDWRFSTFLVAILMLLFGFTWIAAEPALCDAPFIKAVLDDQTKDGAINCFDFWFNRYQTMISAIIAGAIAGAGAVLLFRQTRATERQVAAQRYDFLRERSREIQSLIGVAAQIHRACVRDLFPNRDVRHAGTRAANTLYAREEVIVSVYAEAVQATRKVLDAFERQIDSTVVSEATREVSQDFGLSVHYFLVECEKMLIRPVINLGMGDQFYAPEVSTPTPSALNAIDEVRERFLALNDVGNIELSDLRRRLDGAQRVVL